jgi:hypothetical protein
MEKSLIIISLKSDTINRIDRHIERLQFLAKKVYGETKLPDINERLEMLEDTWNILKELD